LLYVAIAAWAAFILGPLLARLHIVPPLAGLSVHALGGLIGLIVAVGAAVAYGLARREGMLLPLLVACVPALWLIASVLLAWQYPMINDVTTDPSDPPRFEHAPKHPENRGRDMAFPEAAATVIETHYADLRPLALDAPAADVLDRAADTAEGMPGWTVTHVDRPSGTLEGVAVTGVFQFKDDFVVRVRAVGTASVVDMRSKSREGKGDLGANAKRIRRFLSLLQGETP